MPLRSSDGTLLAVHHPPANGDAGVREKPIKVPDSMCMCSLKECLIVVGILLGYLLSYLFIQDVGGWRNMYGAAILPALGLFAGMVLPLPHQFSFAHLSPPVPALAWKGENWGRMIRDYSASSCFCSCACQTATALIYCWEKGKGEDEGGGEGGCGKEHKIGCHTASCGFWTLGRAVCKRGQLSSALQCNARGTRLVNKN